MSIFYVGLFSMKRKVASKKERAKQVTVHFTDIQWEYGMRKSFVLRCHESFSSSFKRVVKALIIDYRKC